MTGATKNQRLLEAASVLLAASDGRCLNTVLLNKAIFYFDLVTLRDTGEAFTQNAFVALHQGPVVAHYNKRLLKPLSEAGIATQGEDGDAMPITLKLEVSYKEMADSVAESARTVGKWFSGTTSGRASEFSHENIGWEMAYSSGLKMGKRPNAINLMIAMQQIVDIDPWIEEPLTEQQKTNLEAVDSIQGEPW